MTVHKVSELTGALLDLAVAICEGYRFAGYSKRIPVPQDVALFKPDHWDKPEVWVNPASKDSGLLKPALRFSPSSSPAQGQPIAEREWIGVERPSNGQKNPAWRAITEYKGPRKPHRFYGPVEGWGTTMLEAMMRAFVASKHGEIIELPDI